MGSLFLFCCSPKMCQAYRCRFDNRTEELRWRLKAVEIQLPCVDFDKLGTVGENGYPRDQCEEKWYKDRLSRHENRQHVSYSTGVMARSPFINIIQVRLGHGWLITLFIFIFIFILFFFWGGVISHNALTSTTVELNRRWLQGMDGIPIYPCFDYHTALANVC